MSKLPFPVWFCRKVPVSRLELRHEFVVNAPWRDALRENIASRGLASPLLVVIKNDKMQVKTGQNRLRCLRELRWRDAPCIVCGELPPGLEGTPLTTLVECQALLADGIICNEQDRELRINTALLPEQGKFPTATVRYYDDD